jgi:hypothetical protein
LEQSSGSIFSSFIGLSSTLSICHSLLRFSIPCAKFSDPNHPIKLWNIEGNMARIGLNDINTLALKWHALEKPRAAKTDVQTKP